MFCLGYSFKFSGTYFGWQVFSGSLLLVVGRCRVWVFLFQIRPHLKIVCLPGRLFISVAFLSFLSVRVKASCSISFFVCDRHIVKFLQSSEEFNRCKSVTWSTSHWILIKPKCMKARQVSKISQFFHGVDVIASNVKLTQRAAVLEWF